MNRDKKKNNGLSKLFNNIQEKRGFEVCVKVSSANYENYIFTKLSLVPNYEKFKDLCITIYNENEKKITM